VLDDANRKLSEEQKASR